MTGDIHRTVAQRGDAARAEWTATAALTGISEKAAAAGASAGLLHGRIVACV